MISNNCLSKLKTGVSSTKKHILIYKCLNNIIDRNSLK